jgi:hypothetical protein
MNMNRKVYTVGAGLMAACMAAATASAQTFMVFEYGASAGAVNSGFHREFGAKLGRRRSSQCLSRHGGDHV